MSIRSTFSLFFIALLSFNSFAQNSFESSSKSNAFAEDDEFLKVEQAYQVVPSVTEDGLRFDWNVHPGYYLYQHQFKVEARNENNKEPLKLSFEKGKKKFDEFFGKELEVYYTSTTVLASATEMEPPYELKVSSQGCADAGLCYPPRHQYFSVDNDGGFTEIANSSFISELNVPVESDLSMPQDAPNIPFVILAAILGGMILNLMPCVFPVLSLKALSFASSSLSPHKQHLHGWAYTAGIVGSFAVAAIVILIARGAGESLGWGFQLQRPGFVTFMAYLFFVMGLSLSGLFHIGTNWMGAGQSLTSGEGLKSSFFTGVLAALVASPCTAPFMASAIGIALTQPAYISLMIFAALGFGMALPFLALSYSPALARFLPAPGAWMDTLKQVLAFPLYLTSIWLLWVLANQTSSSGAMIVLVGAVLITFGIWVLQQSPQSSTWKVMTKGMAVASIVSAGYIGWTVEDYRERQSSQWETYSPGKLASLRAEGTPVFVDLTADWCITCKFNERVAINTDKVAKFAVLNDIVMLQGDWTNEDPEITELLSQFGRSGVPLYLMYPADGALSPEVLPQILTESLVLEAMEKSLL